MHIIETERLRLRPLTASDRADAASVLLNREVMDAMCLPATEEFADKWLADMLEYEQETGFAHRYAERKADGRFIGIVGLLPYSMEDSLCAELGYMIHPDFRRQGYALEATKACLEYGFYTLGADFISAKIVSDNEPSMRLAEKLGMYLLPDVFYIDRETQVMHLFYALSKTMYPPRNASGQIL